MAPIALTIKVAELTDSGWAVAALLLCEWCRLWIFALSAGVIVDNYETRRTLAIATAIQAALAVGLAFSDELPMILMLRSCSARPRPSRTRRSTPSCRAWSAKSTPPGNAYLEGARYTGMIAGPVLAGLLAAGVGTEVALLVDAGTFVVIRVAALLLRVRRAGGRGETLGGGRPWGSA